MQPHRAPARRPAVKTFPLLLLLAVACGGRESPSASPSPSPSPSPSQTTAAPAASAPAASPSAGEMRYFRTPTGNIGCGVSPTSAACDLTEKTWSPPPKPESCEFDWANGVYLRATPAPEAALTCASDTVFNSEAPVLAYGSSITAGTITCESRSDGVRCRDSASGKGFFVSKSRYELY